MMSFKICLLFYLSEFSRKLNKNCLAKRYRIQEILLIGCVLDDRLNSHIKQCFESVNFYF